MFARDGNIDTVRAILDKMQQVQDGGPGSGNFGHKGRPGKRGGSGKGGGKHYRGGSASIGYHGSRKDWVNGLTGAENAKADKIISKWADPVPADKKGYDPIKSAEKNLMSKGNTEQIKQMLDLKAKARLFEDKEDDYAKEFLSDDELKAWDYFKKKGEQIDPSTGEVMFDMDKAFYDMPGEEQSYYLDLKAKMLEGQTKGADMPDSVAVGSGLKQPEKPGIKIPEGMRDWTSKDVDGVAKGQQLAIRLDLLLSPFVDRPGADFSAKQADRWDNPLTSQEYMDAEKKAMDKWFGSPKGLEKAISYIDAKASLSGYMDEAVSGDYNPYKTLSKQEQDEIYELKETAQSLDPSIKFVDDIAKMLVNNVDPQKGQRFLTLVNKAMGGEETAVQAWKTPKQRFAQNPRELMDGIRNATSNDQVHKLIRESELFPRSVDFGSLDVEQSKRAANTVLSIFRDAPGMIDKMRGIDTGQRSSGAYASCTMSILTGVSSLHIGPVMMRKTNRQVDASYQGDVKTNWHPAGTGSRGGVTAVITHEMGHALDSFLRSVIPTYSDPVKLRNQIFKQVTGTRYTTASCADNLSRYAKENAQEFFAEAFTEARLSDKPRPIALAFAKKIKKMMQDNGHPCNLFGDKV